jgi:hypothetical protein
MVGSNRGAEWQRKNERRKQTAALSKGKQDDVAKASGGPPDEEP